MKEVGDVHLFPFGVEYRFVLTEMSKLVCSLFQFGCINNILYMLWVFSFCVAY